MYVTSITMKGRAEKRREIIQTIGGLQEQVRERKGCLHASSYQDMGDNNIFCLVNSWESQEDLDAYLQSRLFSALLGIRSILAETPEIRILVEECAYNCDDESTVQIH
ncbi:MAG: hypothetical protein Kow0089_06360 [Desulfobulbaceae bacterium]